MRGGSWCWDMSVCVYGQPLICYGVSVVVRRTPWQLFRRINVHCVFSLQTVCIHIFPITTPTITINIRSTRLLGEDRRAIDQEAWDLLSVFRQEEHAVL